MDRVYKGCTITVIQHDWNQSFHFEVQIPGTESPRQFDTDLGAVAFIDDYLKREATAHRVKLSLPVVCADETETHITGVNVSNGYYTGIPKEHPTSYPNTPAVVALVRRLNVLRKESNDISNKLIRLSIGNKTYGSGTYEEQLTDVQRRYNEALIYAQTLEEK